MCCIFCIYISEFYIEKLGAVKRSWHGNSNLYFTQEVSQFYLPLSQCILAQWNVPPWTSNQYSRVTKSTQRQTLGCNTTRAPLFPRKLGHILHIEYTYNIFIFYSFHDNAFTVWLDTCKSTIVYKNCETAQILTFQLHTGMLLWCNWDALISWESSLTLLTHYMQEQKTDVTDVDGGM